MNWLTPWTHRKHKRDFYDFIIVGGGSAGCVLARRLVDNGQFTVLLLESGPVDWNPLLHVPAGFTKLTGSSYLWGYKTTPQTGLKGKEVWYPQARVLGGGSSINAQLYTRGHRSDYDNWAANGCSGWSYKDVLPYFVRSEDNERYANRYHGQGGPLLVSDVQPHPLTRAFARAAQQADIPFNPDFNGAEQAGLGYYQVTNRNGRRSSASRCYLQPVMTNQQLCVETGCHVEKIEVRNHRATGIRINGRTIHATKEVVVTAGAIGSPRLLMHSGIGPRDHLDEIGIELILDLPAVGSNLHDHMDVFVVSECSANYSFDRYKNPFFAAKAGIEFALFQSGILSSNICDGGGFWYTDDAQPGPDTQFHFLPGSGLEHGLKPIKNGVTLNSAWTRPVSRGKVRLKSNNPLAKVHVDPNYWGDAVDIKRSLASFRLARHILAQAAFKPFIAQETAPGLDAKTDEDLVAYAAKHAKTDYHPVGTCKMGDADDPTAVVDPELRVKNIESLRVCDSSVMPSIISSNTNAATMMIAERAADFMIRDHSA